MAIQNVTQFKNTLDGYDSAGWIKKAEIGDYIKGPEGINDVGAPSELRGTKSFGEFLTDSLVQVNDLQKGANLAMEKLATGQGQSLHETMLAVEKAELAFKTMNQVRGKVIEAYREIMRMQI